MIAKPLMLAVKTVYFVGAMSWLIFSLLREWLSRRKSSLPQILDICTREMECRLRQRELQFQLKVLFPQGHRNLGKRFMAYRQASAFRNKMRKASEFVYTLDQLDPLNICQSFEAVLNEFIAELRIIVENQANIKIKNKQTKDIDFFEDLQTIPDKWQLREYFLELIKN